MLRLLKLALISFVFFALMITGISLFFPSHIRISKAISIKTSPSAVWREVDNIKNWTVWNPLLNKQSNPAIAYLDTANGIWRELVWNGTRISITKQDSTEHQANWQKDNDRPVINGWVCIPNTDSITVQWYMDFHLHWYPWEKFSSLMLEKNYGPSMEEGLSNLKHALEHQ